MNITVLGAGLIGSAMIKDLALDANISLTVVDFKQDLLDKLAQTVTIKPIQANLQEMTDLTSLLADADLVILAVPGFMGFNTLQKVIEAGKNVVDISFFAEDPFTLDQLAQDKGVTAVVDCGVAPGLSNLIAGYVTSQLDEVERFVCYVGGLPQQRRWPYEYKAVFSPIDVLEEYTRPSRLVEYGQEVIRPALSEVELVDLPGVDTLEAFNTDGLRTLTQTIKAPFMKEKTLRYPGHAALMRVFRETGFFGSEPIMVKGQAVKPLDLTAHLLFSDWHMPAGEADFTVMQVMLEGRKEAIHYRYTYDLLDKYDVLTDTTSMARTTGYTCTLVARQLANGSFTRKGISPPEYVGQTAGCFENLLAGYQARGIAVQETITVI